MRFVTVNPAVVVVAWLAACGGTSNPSPTPPPPPPPPPPAPEHALTVSLSGFGLGTVTSQPAGIDCRHDGGTCSATFAQGTQVTLTAAATGKHVFAGWANACTGTGVCSVTMSGARTVAATFQNPDLAAVEIGPAGGEITSTDGRLTLTIPAGALAEPKTITVEVVPPDELGDEFDELSKAVGIADAWDLGPDGLVFQAPVTVTVKSNMAITRTEGEVVFDVEVLMVSDGTTAAPLEDQVIAETSEGVTVTGTLEHFSTVALSALLGFDVGVDGLPATSGVLDGFLANVFARNEEPETFEVWSAKFLDDSRLPLAIAPGYIFEGTLAGDGQERSGSFPYICTDTGTGLWRGTVSVLLDPFVTSYHEQRIRLRGDVDCVLTPRRLTVERTGFGTGRVTSMPAGIDCPDACQAEFTHGTTVTLTAVADEGSEFVGWSGAGTGDNERTLVLDDNATVTAMFNPAQGIRIITLPGKHPESIFLPFAGHPWAGTDDCPRVTVAVTASPGVVVVDTCSGQVDDHNEPGVPGPARYFALPLGQTGSSGTAVGIFGHSLSFCGVQANGDLGFCTVESPFPGNPLSQYGGASQCGPACGMVTNQTWKRIERYTWNAGGGHYQYQESAIPFPGTPQGIVAFPGGNQAFLVEGGSPGRLHLVDITNPLAPVFTLVGDLGNDPRLGSCDFSFGVCAFANYGSNTVSIVKLNGDAATITDVVPAPGGPVSPFVRGNRVLVPGFTDNFFHAWTVDEQGKAGPAVTTPVPEACRNPGHGMLLPHDRLFVTCFGTDNAILFDPFPGLDP